MYSIFDQSINYSGNRETLSRLSKLLKIKRTYKLVDNVIAINCYKFGLIKTSALKNYIIIVGGTDINFDIWSNYRKFLIVHDTLVRSKYIIAFNKYIYDIVKYRYNINERKIKIIPQSIPKKLKMSKSISIKNFIPSNKKYFVMVGNLRPVKRHEFLFDFFTKSKEYILVIIGNTIEGDYIFPKNIMYLGPLKKKYVYTFMKKSIGLINTSISEGMSLSILEAMKLRCPVYAYNNAGNTAIIKHGFNGYIFNTVKEFELIIKLSTKNIVNNAYDYVYTRHSVENEKQRYLRLLN